MSDQFEDDFIGDVDPENQPYANAENAEIDAEYIDDVAERLDEVQLRSELGRGDAPRIPGAG